ncbi:MAG: slipin family protein [Candidatus Obscuribacterales bacterium]|nr:slipin family protein [Candidatus Obscuribacterales bacterium]
MERWIATTVVGASALCAFVAYSWVSKRLKKIIVWEYQQGLLYRNGAFKKTLGAGAYWIWSPNDSLVVLDSRRQTITLSGQEIITADNVGVKLSMLLTYRIADAAKATNQSSSWYQELYGFAQLAARDVLSNMTVEDLLKARSSLGDQLLEMVKPQAETVGIELSLLQIKDLVLPAEIRKIFGDVLRAQKEGIAALERARGEHAALRSLANAARILENNPALMNLRVLQALTAQGGNVPPTVVLGVPQGLMPVGPPLPGGDFPPAPPAKPPGPPGPKPPPPEH